MGSKSRQPDQQVSIRADLSLYLENLLDKEEGECFSGQRWRKIRPFVWINTLISYFEAEDEALKPGIGWCPEMNRRESYITLLRP